MPQVTPQTRIRYLRVGNADSSGNMANLGLEQYLDPDFDGREHGPSNVSMEREKGVTCQCQITGDTGQGVVEPRGSRLDFVHERRQQ